MNINQSIVPFSVNSSQIEAIKQNSENRLKSIDANFQVAMKNMQLECAQRVGDVNKKVSQIENTVNQQEQYIQNLQNRVNQQNAEIYSLANGRSKSSDATM